MSRKKTIEDLIFEEYSESEHYDDLKYGIVKIHIHMMRNKGYQKMSLKQKFDACITAFLVTQHTLLDHMNNNRPISKKEDTKQKYSIYLKNRKPKRKIELTPSNTLKIQP